MGKRGEKILSKKGRLAERRKFKEALALQCVGYTLLYCIAFFDQLLNIFQFGSACYVFFRNLAFSTVNWFYMLFFDILYYCALVFDNVMWFLVTNWPLLLFAISLYFIGFAAVKFYQHYHSKSVQPPLP